MSAIACQPMSLHAALKRAVQIGQWVTPFCERIEVAGSIRRERPLCNDIDLVCIPKFGQKLVQVDLLKMETQRVNLLREHLIDYVRSAPGQASWKGRSGLAGSEPKPDAKNLLMVTRTGVQLDVWCATPANWVTLLICRTGSMQHNVWCSERARHLRGFWKTYEGLWIFNQQIELATEEDFYRGLGVPFVPPAQRERDFLHQLWRPS